ncbi:TPA: hypothetical protein N0F65_001369 [Lagenidium giganteum]|uniref:Amino acid transporter n=1 Tax=Lagenidium giganteum TaxID=4803 RepID=A0AAV2YVK3_9STRA|nr:TPA: hypothetical protein N0F65_001369 [Lagenidium giganteum]
MRRSLSQRFSSLHDAHSQGTGSSRGYSSFGGLHDGGSSLFHYNHHATPVQRIDEDQVQELSGTFAADSFGTQTRRGLLAAGSVHHGAILQSDLNNVNRLYVLGGTTIGMLLGILLAQVSTSDTMRVLSQWLMLPGDLFIGAMLGVMVPTIFINSMLGIMHFYARDKARRLLVRTLMWFTFSILLASIIGVLLSLCFVPLFQTNTALMLTLSEPVPGSYPQERNPILQIRCPSNDYPLALFQNGELRCTNSTVNESINYFRMEDLTQTFYLSGRDGSRPHDSLSDKAMLWVEGLFPWNAATAFLRGEIASVLLMGTAVGIAIMHTTHAGRLVAAPHGAMRQHTSHARAQSPSLLFLLAMQVEIMLSLLLRGLLQILPVAMVFVVSGRMLQAQIERANASPKNLLPTTQDFVTFLGVLIVGLALDVIVMLAFVFLWLKKNPLQFVRKLLPALLVALGSSSSLVALPSTVRSIAVSREVSMPLAHFVCSSGTSFNKTGSALYMALASVYLLCLGGVRDDNRDLLVSAGKMTTFIFVTAICSMVVPPMPHGNLVAMGTILTSFFGIQWTGGLLAFTTAMDWICDPLTTVVNVLNDALLSFLLANELDEKLLSAAELLAPAQMPGGVQHQAEMLDTPSVRSDAIDDSLDGDVEM